MNKPISVAIGEFERAIGTAINESHLHPSIVKNVLMNYFMTVQEQARQMEIQESFAWEESQKEETAEGEE